MNTQPKRKADELIDRLSFLESGIDEFTSKGIEREANALKKTNAHEAFMVLGILEGIKGNYQDCVSNYSASIKLLDNDIVHSNFAYSLVNLGRPVDALRKIERALSYSKDTIKWHKDSIDIAFLAGELKKTIEFNDKLETLKPVYDEKIEGVIEKSHQLLSLGLPDNYFKKLFPLIEKMVFEFKAEGGSREFYLDLPEQEAFCWIQTNLDTKQTFELNKQFCGKLSEADISPSEFNTFSVLFRAAS